jgi:hypothetical protein
LAPVPAAAARFSWTSLRGGSPDEILDASFAFYRRRFVACFAAMALVQVPVTVGLTLVSQTAQRKILDAGLDQELISQGLTYAIFVFLPLAVLSLAATQVGTGALCYLVGKACLGEPVGVVESYRFAFRRVVPLLGAAWVTALASVVGLLLFVVPGVLVFLLTFATVPAVMLEDLGVRAGLRRSYELATENLARVAAVRLLVVLFVAAGLGHGWIAATGLSDRAETQALLAQVPTLLVGPVDAISTVLLYYDLRVRLEGLDLEQMASELGDA